MKDYLADFSPEEIQKDTVEIRLPQHVWSRLEEIADARGMSLDEHIESLIHEIIFYEEDHSDEDWSELEEEVVDDEDS